MIKEENRIRFHVADRVSMLRDRRRLKKFLVTKVRAAGLKLESLDYIFCSDDYLLRINQDHLKHDDYTDIITFDLSDGDSGLAGEVYISIDRVKENASTFKVPVVQELHRVIFHGLLHLLGYQDKTPKDQKQMRALEDAYLSDYSV